MSVLVVVGLRAQSVVHEGSCAAAGVFVDGTCYASLGTPVT